MSASAPARETARRAARRLAILGSRGIPARYGGFETFAEELSVRLAREGFEVTVFCERSGAEAAPAEHRGVRLEYVRLPGLGALRALLYDLVSLWRARRGWDVVYMLGYGAGVFLWIPRLFGREVWVNMDGREWQRPKWGGPARLWLRLMESAALCAAQRVVFDSAAVHRAVLGERSAARAAVLEYGATLEPLAEDPHVLESLGLRERSYFLVVARLEPENHVLEIVRAVSRSDSELLVVGDLERGGRYARTCVRAAGSRVRFLGSVFDRPTLASLRSRACAVIHGHSVGGTNPSLLEALAAGAPVIAHDNPFNREVLEEGALYFRDESELVGALRSCTGMGAEERQRVKLLSRRRIEARYSWERIAAQYARWLEPAGEPGGSGERDGELAREVPPALPARKTRPREPAAEDRSG